ncbi:MAG: tetratricopeptide repeat protein, partial [Bacteroidales bacterium]|nr:tetratricopeptide repeat protein [Bacteroidales bacterium]
IRAKYWVAVDYLIRARNADSSIAEEANRYISSYSQYFPAQEDAFMYDIIDGASYTVSCSGLRETTTVRTRK